MTPSQKTRGQQRTRTTFPPGGGAASAHGSFSGVGRGQWDRRWACSAGPQLRKKRVPSCLCLQCNGFRSCMYPPLLSSQCPMISAPFPQIPLLIPSTHPQTRGRKMSWNCPPPSSPSSSSTPGLWEPLRFVVLKCSRERLLPIRPQPQFQSGALKPSGQW